MENSVTIMINRYGESIRIKNGESIKEARAIIQPLMYKNKMYVSGTSVSAGEVDGGHYQMIAPADAPFGDYKNTRIETKSSVYTFKRAEVIKAGDTDLYIWAVLAPFYPQGEDDYGKTPLCA